MKISVQDLVLKHGGRTVVDGVSFDVEPGEMLGIIGPNGSGKTTLLRGMSRLHRPTAGRVCFGDTDIHRMSSRELARILAILPQSTDAGMDLTVRELVWRGRFPHQGVFQRETPEHARAVDWAMQVANVSAFAPRLLGHLSGGERQRAWIAMALAQQPQVLLLDEPTSFLDLRHQVEIMRMIRRLNGEGLTVVMVLHDLVLASRYCDRIIAIRDGRVAFDGEPQSVLQPALLEEVFDLPMMVIQDPITGQPIALPREEHPDGDSYSQA